MLFEYFLDECGENMYYQEVPAPHNSLTSLSQLSQSIGGTINFKESSKSPNIRGTPTTSPAYLGLHSPAKNSWSNRFVNIYMPRFPRLSFSCFLSSALVSAETAGFRSPNLPVFAISSPSNLSSFPTSLAMYSSPHSSYPINGSTATPSTTVTSLIEDSLYPHQGIKY